MKKYAKLLIVPAAFLALGSYSATTTDTIILTDGYETIKPTTTTEETPTNKCTYQTDKTYYVKYDAFKAGKACSTEFYASSKAAEDAKAGYAKCKATSTTECEVSAVVVPDATNEKDYSIVFGKTYKVPYTLNVGSGNAVTVTGTVTLNGTLVAGSQTTITGTGTLKGDVKTAGADVDADLVDGKITYTVDAPNGVEATYTREDGTDKITVTWDEVEEADGYVVYKSTSKSSGYAQVKSLGEDDELEFEDTSVTSGKTYYYKVKAKRNSSTSDFSELTDDCQATVAVAAPKTLKVKEASYNSITVTAGKVSNASGYEFYRWNGTEWKLMKTQSSNVYTNTSVLTGTKYYYTVRAYVTVDGKKVYGLMYDTANTATIAKNNEKTSDELVTALEADKANIATATYAESATATLGKTTLSAKATASTTNPTIKFTFTKVTGANGYCIYSDTIDPTTDEDTYCTTGTSLTLKKADLKLAAENTYDKVSYTAKAYRTVNSEKKYSEESKAVKVGLKPNTPKLVKKNVVNKGQTQEVTIAGVTGADAAEDYYLYVATSKNGTYKLVENAGEYDNATNTVKIVNDELTYGKTYYYKTRIKVGETYSDYSSVVSKELSVPEFTKNGSTTSGDDFIKVQINGAHSNLITLDLKNAEFGIKTGVDGFAISRRITSSGTWKVMKTIKVDPEAEGYDNIEWKHLGLTTGKTYYYRVRAYSLVDGKKVYGKYSTVVSKAPKAPAPETVYVEGTDKSVALTWDKVKNVTGYKIYRDDKLIATTSKLTYTDKSVEEGETYTYVVKAYVKVKGTNKIGFASAEVDATAEDGFNDSKTITLEESIKAEDED